MSELPIFKFAIIEELKDDKRFLPTRAEEKATGWDVQSAKTLTVKPFEYIRIPLGFRSFCPEGWWYELRPRSSTFAKKSLHTLYGVIDQTYEGQLLFGCQYVPDMEFEVDICEDHQSYRTDIVINAEHRIIAPNLTIEFGEAIGQIVPIRREEMIVQEVTNKELDADYLLRAGQRGDGGFGSTSK